MRPPKETIRALVTRSTVLRPTTSRWALAPNNRGSSWRSATGAGHSAQVSRHIVARSNASGRIPRGHGARVPAVGFRRVWAVEDGGPRPRGVAPHPTRRVPPLRAEPMAPSRPPTPRRSTRLRQGRSSDRLVASDPPAAPAARVDPEPSLHTNVPERDCLRQAAAASKKPCATLDGIAGGGEATRGAARCGLRDGFIG